MKYITSCILLTCYLLMSTVCRSQSVAKGNVLFGVFDGRTPCEELVKLLNEEKPADCIKIKWRLILYKDSITGRPSLFELQGFMRNKKDPYRGKWQIILIENNEQTMYRLNLGGKNPLLLLKADDNILFFVDEKNKILVGNQDFSYSLNRIEKKL